MASYYVTVTVQAAIKAEAEYYAGKDGEARAEQFENQYLALLDRIAANPYRAGVSVPKMPASHRRTLIGKTHWLYYRIDAGGGVLIYWMHGRSQETKKLTPSSLKRKASEASKERDSSTSDDVAAADLLAAATQADLEATEYGTAEGMISAMNERTAARRTNREAPTEEGS